MSTQDLSIDLIDNDRRGQGFSRHGKLDNGRPSMPT
jgi:hypothetical protein